MTFNELRYIVAVAQERNFGRAAQHCFISQPALSVAIQKLEEELGTQIFERGKNEVTVTPVGERIVEQAQKVLEEAASIRDIAQAGRNQLVGLFRLGAKQRASFRGRPHLRAVGRTRKPVLRYK
jgi:LysR family hydrogen peroxide-inducible transcriptional activator